MRSSEAKLLLVASMEWQCILLIGLLAFTTQLGRRCLCKGRSRSLVQQGAKWAGWAASQSSSGVSLKPWSWALEFASLHPLHTTV